MFSHPGPGRLRIAASGRKGHPFWTQASFYVHRNQIWTLSFDMLVASARADLSRPGNRNMLSPLAFVKTSETDEPTKDSRVKTAIFTHKKRRDGLIE